MTDLIKILPKKLGFGCMRLPMNKEEIDFDEFTRMVDTFMENGFNYFDTACMYVDGRSEGAIKRCLTQRYPRDSYVLTDKLSYNYFNNESEVLTQFERQLAECGVEYFDFYLMHAQSAGAFEKYKSCKAYETSLKLRDEGKIKHFGISFHDTPEVLDMILREYPQIEVVQLQFNYFDYDNPTVRARECYEVCMAHGKPVIVMEPVRGGSLVNIPDAAKSVFDSLGKMSYASYAIRYAASFDGVAIVLSGMSNISQMDDNISYMKDFQKLSNAEADAVERVRDIMRLRDFIPCTGCRYCTTTCPQNIPIPEIFSCLNHKRAFANDISDKRYANVKTRQGAGADACIGCGACEQICPQHINVREFISEAAETFEGKNT